MDDLVLIIKAHRSFYIYYDTCYLSATRNHGNVRSLVSLLGSGTNTHVVQTRLTPIPFVVNLGLWKQFDFFI